jgi:DNA replication protein DnaC
MMIRCVVREALEVFDSACLMPFDSETKKHQVQIWMACDARDLGNAVQRTGLGEKEPEIIIRAANADVLIMEDLGWERSFHIESLLDVAAPRYKRQKPSIITSGEKHDALRERYTDAVLRRFWDIEGKNGAVVDCWKAK